MTGPTHLPPASAVVPAPPPTEPAPPSAPAAATRANVATCGDCAADLVAVGFPKAVGGTIGLGVVCSAHPTGNAPQATSLFDGDRAVMREYTAAALKTRGSVATLSNASARARVSAGADALDHSTALTLLAAWSQGDGTKVDANAIDHAVSCARQLRAAVSKE